MVIETIENETMVKQQRKISELQNQMFQSAYYKLKALKQQQLLFGIVNNAINENQKMSELKKETVETIEMKLKMEASKNQGLKLDVVLLAKKLKDEQFKKSLFSDKYNELLQQIKRKE